MTEITLHYPPKHLKEWKRRRLHQKWYKRNKDSFCKRDLSNAVGQCHKGYHFGEWFTLHYYRKLGYEVLPPKYLLKNRIEARRKATQILGKLGVKFLIKRKILDSRLRKPPKPDLLVFTSNFKTFFFVEVKRDADRLSRAQRQFFPKIEHRFGCDVVIAKLLPVSHRSSRQYSQRRNSKVFVCSSATGS